MMTEEAKRAKREYMRNYKANVSEEAKEQRNKNQREWRRKNPDKVQKYNTEYWERKACKGMDPLTRAMMQNFVEVPMCEPCEAPRKAESLKPDIEGQVKELNKQGLSLREIGSRLSISHMKVSRILKDCNSL